MNEIKQMEKSIGHVQNLALHVHLRFEDAAQKF